eukprot:TRINITY_DN2187_c0_g2_i2.p1 TRINITY_DN2187_c0_g2~~TRINITY_DN2187_c0_g2_i2.p1  ORF type:complete len:238 (+),score=49.72 TRINITY_DN2187_c0_g2_i2:931-1644(+)
MTPFFLAHWEEYFTGELVLGKFNSPLEAQITMMTIYVATAVGGGDIWRKQFTIGNYTLETGEMLVYTTYICGVFTCSQNFKNVYAWMQNKKRSFFNSLSVLVPYLLLSSSSLLYLWISPDMLQSHPQLVVLMIGTVHAYIVGRLILQRVCRETYQTFYYINLIPIWLCVDSFMKTMFTIPIEYSASKDLFLWIGCLASLGMFFHMGISVAIQMSDYLKIMVFRITKPQERVDVENAK